MTNKLTYSQRIGRDLWRLSGPIPYSKQGQLQNYSKFLRAVSSWVLNACRYGDAPHLFRQPVIVFDHLHGEQFFPYIESKFCLLLLGTAVPCPFALHLQEQPGSDFSILPIHAVEDCNEISLELFFPGWTSQHFSVSPHASCRPVSQLLDGPPPNYL